MQSGGDQTGDVSDIDNHVGADCVACLANSFKIPESWIGRGARHDHLGLNLACLFDEPVVVNRFRIASYLVAGDLKEKAGKIPAFSLISIRNS